jgi:hypothetical protein
VKNDGKVRVLVGTRKGGYILTSNRARKTWDVKGPFQPGVDVFHVVADPRHPGEVYAAANSGFWGPMLVKSKDWGAHWKEIATPLLPKQSGRKPVFELPPDAVKPIINLWHIEPGRPEEPDTIYLGVDPASLYRSDDRGASWSPMEGLNQHSTRPKWNPGAGGMCLHSILWDPSNRDRMFVGISAAGVFRSDDAGATWTPKNQGVVVSFQPEEQPEVGQCVHHIALDPRDPNTVYRQDHDGIYVSHDAGDLWKRVGRPLPSDFGFVVATAPTLPGTAFFVPLHGMYRTAMNGQLQVYKWTEKDRKFTATVKGKPWRGELGTHREGLATDALDPAGIYLGTTSGQLYYSRNGARSWNEVPYRFPGIHSVSVASPPA